ncbi:bifunctional 3-oxoadipate enol-lactonase/4-carboxymuconolactone decarboxylase PcaDC [Belnapia rosea]|uniref:bifunctional 3-oxoadipate enol-lactonase/4-carboxymuconolactone decarboxylase PcaDC n=1 Tax=Belnapia rosea TaxID=938405 RepID=UPI00087F2B6B|nr:4-carboxymuconolactone decarboxylase [Belnapia rosea]SDB36973.1 3-oxoadipate enol-lactonase / 4-carboxymuconolactone decarboxylase [Belnapia rosea]
MFIQLDDIAVHAEVSGPDSGPPVLLLHSLGTNFHMWDPQAKALAKRHRVIRMDMRGHGLTEATPGPYTMDRLAQDALALLHALGIHAAHVAGVSIGGHIAMRMAALAPERILSLMPCDTALDFGGATNWQGRMDAVAAGGMAAVADATLGRWVLDRSLASSKGLGRMLLTTDPAGWLGCAAALRDTTGREVPGRVRCPTTILVGDRDESTPVAAAQAIHAAIPESKLVIIAEAAHIPNFEREEAMTRALLAHMKLVTALPASAAEAGMAVRRRILGEAHVDRSEAALTALDMPFRDFILEGVWGRVWTRPGLSYRDRSLLCLGILAALGHHDEFRLHVRATANTGVTPEEIAEILLQVAAYAGVPTANTALRLAKDILKEMEG